MPRMVASLATFVLIVVSIGINIWRYPVVLEMVGQPSESSQPEQPAQSTPISEKSETASSAQSESLASYAPGSTYSAMHASSQGAACDGYSCKIASSGSKMEQPYSYGEDTYGYTDKSAAGDTNESAVSETDSYGSYSYDDSENASAESWGASDDTYRYAGSTYPSEYSSAGLSEGGNSVSGNSSLAAESNNGVSSNQTWPPDQRWSANPITTPGRESTQTPIVVRPSKELVRVAPTDIANDLARGRHSAATVLRLPPVDQGDRSPRWSNVGRRNYPSTGL